MQSVYYIYTLLYYIGYDGVKVGGENSSREYTRATVLYIDDEKQFSM